MSSKSLSIVTSNGSFYSEPNILSPQTPRKSYKKHSKQTSQQGKHAARTLRGSQSSPTPIDNTKKGNRNDVTIDAECLKGPVESCGFEFDNPSERNEGHGDKNSSDGLKFNKSATVISEEVASSIKGVRSCTKDLSDAANPSDFDNSYLNSMLEAVSITDGIPSLAIDDTDNLALTSADETTTSLLTHSMNGLDGADGSLAYISPWQRWFITKEAEAREKTLQEQRRAARLEREELRKQQERERKQMKAKEEMEAWIVKKKTEEYKQKVYEMRKLEEARQRLEMEKEQMERDREESFKRWQQIKAQQAAEKKREGEKLEAMKEIELQNKQEDNFRAFIKWYKQSTPAIRELKDSSSYVTIGFAGQKIQAIYDRSTHRKPNFVNPNEWVGLDKGDGGINSNEENSDDEEHVFRVWAEACKSDVGVRTRVTQPLHNAQSLTNTRKSTLLQNNTKKAQTPKKPADYNPTNPGGKQASWRRMQEEMVKGVQTQRPKTKKKTKVQKKPAGSLEPVPVKRRVRNENTSEQVLAN